MTPTTQGEAKAEAVLADRRRPGRLAHVNPALIPLLRAGELPAEAEDAIVFDEPDSLAGARGILVGVAISAPLWVGIAFLGRWLFS